MLRVLTFCLLLTLVPPVLALSTSGVSGATEPEAASELAPDGDVARLVEILRDDARREALIEALSTTAGEVAAPATTVAEDAPLPRRIAQYTRDAAEGLTQGVARGEQILTEVAYTFRAAVNQPQPVIDAALLLLAVIVSTVAVFYVLDRLARRFYAWLGNHAEAAGRLRSVLLLVASTATDLIVILLAWAVGYALALLVFGEAGRMDVRQSLYLNAFLIIEVTKVALRGVFAPKFGALRLLPLSDLDANYWYFWLSRIVAVLGYGLLLVVPIVAANLPDGVALALQVLIGLSATAMLVTLVLQNREPVARLIRGTRPEGPEDLVRTVRDGVARIWHLLAIGYVASLFVVWLTRPEAGIAFMVRATIESLVALLIGIVASNLVSRLVRGGLHLPHELQTRLPLLESRLNAFVPLVLRIVRGITLVAVVLVIADAWGMFSLVEWATSQSGQSLVGTVFGVAIILLVAFLVWLALTSWIEYRLNPDVGTVAGARARTLLALLRNAATVAIVTVAAMSILSEIGVDIGPLLAGAGVLGLAIGFGAQKLVQDIITGVFIQFENAINEGDFILAGGNSGTVEKLTIRSVGLRDLHGTYHLVPFSSVDAVSNFTRGFAYYLAEIGVAYREDIDEVKAVMYEAFERLVAEEEWASAIIAPLEWNGLARFDDSAVVLRARIKTLPGRQWAAGRAYNAHIKRLFDEKGIEIPFPHRTIWFGEDRAGHAPPLRASLASGEAPAELPAPDTGQASDSPSVRKT